MDISLHYRERGEGFPLILLHGNGESGEYFINQIEEFAGAYRVIAVDTRAHGGSPRGTAEFSIHQFAEDLKGFMEELGLERAILLGFSDGANIAMRFALRYPDMVAGLILNGGNLDAKGVKRRVQLPIELGYRIAACFAARSDEAKRNMELLGLMVNEPNISPQELKSISAPTLVVAGTRDMIKSSHTRLIAASIPKARLRFIPGTHFIANKEPAAFKSAVWDFLRALKRPPN